MILEPDIGRAALKFLASREHSRGELRRKLCACGYAAAEVERLIEDLAKRGLVSDRRMVETYVDERVRKGFGPVRIRQELRHRGLADMTSSSHPWSGRRENGWLPCPKLMTSGLAPGVPPLPRHGRSGSGFWSIGGSPRS